jgi:hypothetical protein
MSKIDKHFVSEIDKKMAEFNETHPRSAEQQAEYDKYQRIYMMRDVPTECIEDQDSLWD